jgi:hypothetical protein
MNDPIRKVATSLGVLFGLVIALMSADARADELKALIHTLNAPAIPTDGQIWLEERSDANPVKKCGEPDREMTQKLLRQINAVVATQDGQAVRIALGRCQDQLNTCMTLTSDEAVQRFQAWSLQALEAGKGIKKEISVELSGVRYFLHDVSPQSMTIQDYSNHSTRIYEYKIGSLESFK